MTYGRMPLFPPGCGGSGRLHMPLSCESDYGCARDRACEDCQTVRIRNPACPGDYADVELCVDMDGNLSVCVRRPQQSCACTSCRKRRPRCGCGAYSR